MNKDNNNSIVEDEDIVESRINDIENFRKKEKEYISNMTQEEFSKYNIEKHEYVKDLVDDLNLETIEVKGDKK